MWVIIFGSVLGALSYGRVTALPQRYWLSAAGLSLLILLIRGLGQRWRPQYDINKRVSVNLGIQLALLLTSFVAMSGYVNQRLDNYLSQRLSHPVNVQAIVRVETLSDRHLVEAGQLKWLQHVEIIGWQGTNKSIPLSQVSSDLIAALNQPDSAGNLETHWIHQERQVLAHAIRVMLYPNNDASLVSQPPIQSNAIAITANDLNDYHKEANVNFTAMHPVGYWIVQVKLKPPIGSYSQGNFDVTKWLMQQEVHAIGYVQQALSLSKNQSIAIDKALSRQKIRQQSVLLAWIAKVRQQLRNRIVALPFGQPVSYSLLGNDDTPYLIDNYSQDRAVLLGLLTGDRALISTEYRSLYRQMGISHLLAISGTHVIFAALVSGFLLKWLLSRWVGLLRRVNVSLVVMVWACIVTLLYALLAGFDVPAQRTFWMVLIVTLAQLLHLRLSSGQILIIAALAIILWQPSAVTQAGFWLSVVAVWFLQRYSQREPSSIAKPAKVKTQPLISAQSQQIISHIGMYLLSLTKLQLVLFFLLLPLTLAFFGQQSLLAPLVNLIAIPVLSLVVVPVNIMAALLTVIAPSMATLLWQLMIYVLHGFHQGLFFLNEIFPNVLRTNTLDNVGLMTLGLMAVLWSLPRGILSLWYALPLMVTLISLLVLPKSYSQVRIDVIDSNQWLLVVVRYRADSWVVLSALEQSVNTANAALSIEQSLAGLGVRKLKGLIIMTNDEPLYRIGRQLNQLMVIHNNWVPTPDQARQVGLTARRCTDGQSLINGSGSDKSPVGNIPPLQLHSYGNWQALEGKLTMPVCYITVTATQGGQHSQTGILPATIRQTQQLQELMCQSPKLTDIIMPAAAQWDSRWLAAQSLTTMILVGHNNRFGGRQGNNYAQSTYRLSELWHQMPPQFLFTQNSGSISLTYDGSANKHWWHAATPQSKSLMPISYVQGRQINALKQRARWYGVK